MKLPRTGGREAVAIARSYTPDFLLAVIRSTHQCRRPVTDKPFPDSLGRRLENFTRVETFGDNQANGNNDVHWLKVVVDARARDVFAYQPQIVPANRTAVPAP